MVILSRTTSNPAPADPDVKPIANKRATVRLLPLPPHPILRILNHHALRLQLHPNRIRARKVPRLLRLRPLRHQSLNLRVAQPHRRHQLRSRLIASAPHASAHFQSRPRKLRVPVLQHREHAIEQRQHRAESPPHSRPSASPHPPPSSPPAPSPNTAAAASAVFRSFASAVGKLPRAFAVAVAAHLRIRRAFAESPPRSIPLRKRPQPVHRIRRPLPAPRR